jgi:hypothetical protein
VFCTDADEGAPPEVGISRLEAAKLMGHVSMTVTEKYTLVPRSGVGAVVQRLLLA